MIAVEKRAVYEQVRATLSRAADVLRQAVASAREGATHEETKPEDDKDTRALEASYLAGAQAARLGVLEGTVKRFEFDELRVFRAEDPVAPGALVQIELDGVASLYLLADVAGGTKVEVGGVEVQVLSPEAPLAQAMLGRRVGDSFERVVRGDVREYEIVGIR